MRIIATDTIEFAEVNFSELYGEMRIDSQYYEPFYIRNAEKLASKPHKAIKEFMNPPQYGISIAMNEIAQGYKILKMDDIIDILSNDENAKFADISSKIFEMFELKKFDVLFNRVNSDEYVGRTGIYLMDGEHTFASYLVRISSDKTFHNCYLTAYLNCNYGYHALQRVKRRAVNQANINAQELKELIIPFPSENFQKQIEKLIVDANTLKKDSVNNFRDATEILLNELNLSSWCPEQIDFSINHSIFNSDDSISIVNLSEINLKGRLDGEYWQNYLLKLEEKVKNYGNGWGNLGAISNLYDNNYSPNPEQNYKYIELSNIGLFGDITGYTENKGANLPTRARRIIREGQVIVSSIEGSLSSSALITSEYNNSICSTGFYVIDSEEINSETLITMLKSAPFQHLLKRGCSGTILTAINKRFLSLIPLPLVDKKIQLEIKRKVKEMYLMREKSNKYLWLAKKAVEIYIEKDEEAGSQYIADNI